MPILTFLQDQLDGLDYQLLQENGDGGRCYVTPQGHRYPSVSTVTGILGRDAIQAWRRRVGPAEANRVSSEASTRGNKLHKVCESYLNNELTQWESLAMGDMTERLFRQLQPVLDRHVTKVYGTEVQLYSDLLRLAGTCDALVEWNGVLTIIDYKTSGKPKRREWVKNYLLQCTAYALMVSERTGKRVPQFAVCIATEGQTEPTIFHERTKDHLTDLHELLVTYGTFPAQTPQTVVGS
jgi:hypothetical protein